MKFIIIQMNMICIMVKMIQNYIIINRIAICIMVIIIVLFLHMSTEHMRRKNQKQALSLRLSFLLFMEFWIKIIKRKKSFLREKFVYLVIPVNI